MKPRSCLMIARVRRARYALATTEPCRRCFVAAGLSCSGRFTLCAALQSSMHVTRKSGCEASRFRAGYSVIAQHHCIPYTWKLKSRTGAYLFRKPFVRCEAVKAGSHDDPRQLPGCSGCLGLRILKGFGVCRGCTRGLGLKQVYKGCDRTRVELFLR